MVQRQQQQCKARVRWISRLVLLAGCCFAWAGEVGYSARAAAERRISSLPKGERQTLVEVASTSSADGYVSELQRAVNVARKAEQRVKKLAGEKQDRVQQWRDYEAELKRCYSVEKQHFRTLSSKELWRPHVRWCPQRLL